MSIISIGSLETRTTTTTPQLIIHTKYCYYTHFPIDWPEQKSPLYPAVRAAIRKLSSRVNPLPDTCNLVAGQDVPVPTLLIWPMYMHRHIHTHIH
jgi:hypothetical protein